MDQWMTVFRANPVNALLAADDPAITYFVKRDLRGAAVPPLETLWQLPEVHKIFKHQRSDGSWPYRGKQVDVYPPHHYPLVETWKQYRILVRNYGVTKDHPKGAAAAEYLFGCQTAEGDIRGMLGNQYATYYTGAMFALLILAGYEKIPSNCLWSMSLET